MQDGRDELKRSFDAEGFIRCIDVLPPERAAYYLTKLESFIEHHRSHPDFDTWVYGKSHLLLPWVSELAAEPALLDADRERSIQDREGGRLGKH